MKKAIHSGNHSYKSYPHQKETVDKAAGMIRLYREQEFFSNEENKDLVWQRISQSVEQSDTVQKKRIFRMPVFLRVAAAVIIVAGVLLPSGSSSRNSDKTYTIATVSGQIKTITLPDNSKVTLNGNSTLIL